MLSTKGSTIFLVLLILTIWSNVSAQYRPKMYDGIIRGHVFDSELETPIEYANIVLYRERDSLQVTGTVTNPDGDFQLTNIRPDAYYLQISFIGYQVHTIGNIKITPTAPEVNLGNISLEQTILQVEGTEAVAERPALSYQIDKKVVNVGRQTTAVSGTAVDVLENVPSVDVDIEGNVSLRGSENFTVLIDGRPTVLDPSEALQQIPASIIESIEIITNPSAKYDPDGISGIINIIMKKKRLQGISGLTNLKFGLDNKYGGAALLSFRKGIYNVYIGADYSKMTFPGTRYIENMTMQNDTTSYVFSNGDSRWQMNPYGVRGGIDLAFGARDKLSLTGRYGNWGMQSTSATDYDEWSEPGSGHSLYLSKSDHERLHEYYSSTLDYLHHFPQKGHQISVETYFNRSQGDEESTSELFDTTGIITSGQRNGEKGPSTMLRSKLDYTLPLQKNNKFELGYQSRINRSENISDMYEYDTLTGAYEFMPLFSHTSKYTHDIHSLYSMYSGEWGRFGYQGGLRGEYTYRLIELVGETESFTIDRWDYFPTAHISYQFPGGQQIMASYTRRIKRPRVWWLEPFLTWSDAYNVRKGNPALKPEYINSCELGFQTFLGKSLFSTEAYYRIVQNKVERVRSVYSDDVFLHTVENVGTDYALGVEFMLDLKLLKWWNINCTADLYDHRIEGVLYGEQFSEHNFNWSTRFSNELKLLKDTKLQINGRYRGPRVTAQGERESYFTTDAALKQEFLNKQLSVTLQVRDIFGTSRREHSSEGPDFSSYSYFTRKSPVVMLNISYNFNNYKADRQHDDEQEFEGMEEL